MKLTNKENLQLVVEDGLLNRLSEIGISHFPNEFGGFLIGTYSADFKTVYVNDFVLPQKYKGAPFAFERNTDGLTEEFNKLFKEKKQYYIGEWHTHPNGSTMYSSIDLKSMTEIVECATVQIQNPLLLILSINEKIVKDYTFYYYQNKKLIPYG